MRQPILEQRDYLEDIKFDLSDVTSDIERNFKIDAYIVHPHTDLSLASIEKRLTQRSWRNRATMQFSLRRFMQLDKHIEDVAKNVTFTPKLNMLNIEMREPFEVKSPNVLLTATLWDVTYVIGVASAVRGSFVYRFVNPETKEGHFNEILRNFSLRV